MDEFSGRAWLQVNAVRVGLVSRVVNLDAVLAGDGEQLIDRIEANVGHLKHRCTWLENPGEGSLRFMQIFVRKGI